MVERDEPGPVRLVAGADVSYDAKSSLLYAALVVLDAQTLELLVADGHGRAHPRRFGFASHLAVVLDMPTIGCAKSRLVGEHREPGPRRGARAALRDQGCCARRTA